MLEILKCYCKYSLKILDNIYNIHRKFSAKVQQISEIRKALDKKNAKNLSFSLAYVQNLL